MKRDKKMSDFSLRMARVASDPTLAFRALEKFYSKSIPQTSTFGKLKGILYEMHMSTELAVPCNLIRCTQQIFLADSSL